MAFSRQEDWSGLPFPTPRNVPNPGLEPTSTDSPVLASRFFTASATWEAGINNKKNYHCCDVVVQWLSHVQLFVTPWTAAHQAFLSLTISQRSPKFKSAESVMPSKRLILCHSLSFAFTASQHQVFSMVTMACLNHFVPIIILSPSHISLLPLFIP